MHREIEDLCVYMQHETGRKGSPYTLVLTGLVQLELRAYPFWGKNFSADINYTVFFWPKGK